MSRIPTYILAPNFTLTDGPTSPYHPWLGNIIADPLRPTTRILDRPPSSSSLSENPPPLGGPRLITTVRESNTVHTQTTSRSLNFSLWANFLSGTASASIGGVRTRDVTTTYRPTRGLETRYFEPTDDEVRDRIAKSPRVRAAMAAGLRGKSPVFMITGIKVAKGLRVESSVATRIGGSVGGSGPAAVAGAVSVGAQVGADRSKEVAYASSVASPESDEEVLDIVFAYQVHVIAEKGWREKNRRVETEVYISKHAFLGKDAEEDESDRLGASVLVEEDLEDLEELGGATSVVEVEGEGGEKCVCIMPVVAAEE